MIAFYGLKQGIKSKLRLIAEDHASCCRTKSAVVEGLEETEFAQAPEELEFLRQDYRGCSYLDDIGSWSIMKYDVQHEYR